MDEQVFFLNMFPDYEPPEDLQQVLSQAAVVAADIDPAKGTVAAVIHSGQYIPKRSLNSVSSDICTLYGLRSLELTATHPADQLTKIEPEELMGLFVAQNSMARGSLAGAQWQWTGEKLTVQLLANGKETLVECVPQVTKQLQERFGVCVTVEIRQGENLEGEALFAAMEKMRGSLLQTMPRTVAASVKNEQPVQESDAFYGKSFKGKPVSMQELNLDMGTVIVEGKVFNIEHKELSKRNAWVINFDITDHISSVRVSRFLENKEAKPILEQIKLGSVVKVQGKLMVDNFTNEMVLKPFAIMPGSLPKRKDTAEGMKRVELHLHTTMSNMDALTITKEAIKQAAAWGHRAIAITDHGCVQSFTDALHAVEDRKGAPKVAGTDEDIKILYGCEAYYVNDVDDLVAVRGQKNINFDDEYVAFDLETTGLYARRDRIIEIGAVRMKNGQEIDRFQTFVDPGCTLEKRTVELTGITDEMLRGAPEIQQALPAFLSFVKDSVLVAHNASFDISFIEKACAEQGIDQAFTCVDTLALSQNLLPQLNRFSLDVVAKEFELEDFNHHRAGDDALICGKIMGRLAELLKQMDVQDLQSVNQAMEPLRIAYRQRAAHAPCQHIVLFAKNQLGLRNLYHLISDANLKYFKKFPRVFKSELIKLREGLIVGSACENNELFQAVVMGRGQHAVNGRAKRSVAGGLEHLLAVAEEGEGHLRMGQGLQLHRSGHPAALHRVGFHEFHPGRGVVEQIPDDDGGALWAAGLRFFGDGAGLQMQTGAGHGAGGFCHQINAADGGNGGQCLPPEAHGGNGGQIFGPVELGGGVAQKGGLGVLSVHAAAVVGDAQEGHAAVLDLHGDLGRTGIHGVFQQFLDDGGGPLHHLAGGDQVGYVLG